MKSFFTLFIICTLAFGLHAQISPSLAMASAATVARPYAVQFRHLPAMPPGVGLASFLSAHLHYPTLAEDHNIEGTVVVAIVVDARGRVTGRRVVRRAHFLLNEAAMEATRQLPQMLPAVENGLPVAGTLMIPFRFRL